MAFSPHEKRCRREEGLCLMVSGSGAGLFYLLPCLGWVTEQTSNSKHLSSGREAFQRSSAVITDQKHERSRFTLRTKDICCCCMFCTFCVLVTLNALEVLSLWILPFVWTVTHLRWKHLCLKPMQAHFVSIIRKIRDKVLFLICLKAFSVWFVEGQPVIFYASLSYILELISRLHLVPDRRKSTESFK